MVSLINARDERTRAENRGCNRTDPFCAAHIPEGGGRPSRKRAGREEEERASAGSSARSPGAQNFLEVGTDLLPSISNGYHRESIPSTNPLFSQWSFICPRWDQIARDSFAEWALIREKSRLNLSSAPSFYKTCDQRSVASTGAPYV